MMPVCRVLGESPGCTCCSHRLPPRDSPSLGPSQDLGTHSAQQVVGASSRSPQLPWLPGYGRVGRNPLPRIPPSCTLMGFARTFQ